MKCPNCGRENIPGTPFCADCGKNLFANNAQSTQVEQLSDAASTSASTPASSPAVITVTETVATANEEPAPAAEGAAPTPIITDGGIFFAPVDESAAVSPSESEPAPEPEPIPDPEPAQEFVAAFDDPAVPESQTVAEEVAVEMTEDSTEEPAVETFSSIPAPPPAPATTEAPVTEAAVPEAGSAEPAVPVSETAEASVASDTSADPASEPSQPASEQSPTQQPPAPQGEPQFAPFADAPTPIVPPNPARPHTIYAQPGGEALYKKGCLAAAWDDILQSKGWFGKMLLLGLIYCVPILNFFVSGYAMRWSRELFLGKVAPMPQRIFGNRMFVNGFFSFVLELVVGIVVCICGVVLEFIPFIGAIAYLALTFFVSAFEYLAIMRIAIADRLGAGFDISQIWQTGKRHFGALCCATVVPLLIIGAIVTVICFAVCLIMIIPLMGSIAELSTSSYAYGYYYSDAQVVAAIMEMILIMLPMLLVMYVIMCLFSGFTTVLVMRATGHFVARYAHEWKSEQAVMSTAYINDASNGV